MSTAFAIYSDDGAAPELVEDLQRFVSTNYSNQVDLVSAKDCITGTCFKNLSTFIMPGGADLPYLEKLSGQGSARLRTFVESGGYYVGFCAGAYFGSSSIIFDGGLASEISGPRPLEFFRGQAIGPVFGAGTYDYNSRSGARAAQIDSQIPGVPNGHIYYNGGCYFSGAQDSPIVQVLATFAELPQKPAAIIMAQCGRGVAALSGVHPEFNIERLNRADRHEESLFQMLNSQRSLAQAWLHRLFVKAPSIT